jgi:hypothetical protein
MASSQIQISNLGDRKYLKTYTASRCRPMWAGLLIPTPGLHQRRPPPILLPPCTIQPPPPCCSAPHRPLLHPPSPATDEPPPSCTTEPKEVPRHRTAPAPRICPRCRLMKLSNGSSPTIILLREHPTGGSPLRLFSDPIDPTKSSASPRSSSPTTSMIASTTPLARPPRQCTPP